MNEELVHATINDPILKAILSALATQLEAIENNQKISVHDIKQKINEVNHELMALRNDFERQIDRLNNEIGNKIFHLESKYNQIQNKYNNNIKVAKAVTGVKKGWYDLLLKLLPLIISMLFTGGTLLFAFSGKWEQLNNTILAKHHISQQ